MLREVGPPDPRQERQGTLELGSAPAQFPEFYWSQIIFRCQVHWVVHLHNIQTFVLVFEFKQSGALLDSAPEQFPKKRYFWVRKNLDTGVRGGDRKLFPGIPGSDKSFQFSGALGSAPARDPDFLEFS